MHPLLKKISLIPTYILVILFFMITLFLYWPSLQGEPIWDDLFFIFRHPVITGEYSYLKILTDFAWPLSVTFEKLFYQIWGENYLYYHLVNFVMHLLNALLLLRIVQRLSVPFPKFIFLIFLVHPANVLSVSWMIQFKTLLCFSFAALSLLCLLKVNESKKWYIPSWIFYFLSLLSKSASIPLGLFLFFHNYKNKTKREFLWATPLIVLSLLSSYQMLKSEVTASGIEQVKDKDLVVVNETTKIKKTPIPQEIKKAATPETKPEIKPEVKVEKASEESFNSWQMILATSHYYFWQVILPLEIHPIKGPVPSKNLFMGYGHFFVLLLIFFLSRNTRAFWCLLTGQLMLTPFLGLLPAPFMNITWVSDQHLYLALPFFLVFWAELISKLNPKFKFILLLPIILVLYFVLQTSRATPLYKNEIIFYSASLEEGGTNLPIAYNLAEAYLSKGKIYDALYVTSKVVISAQTDASIRNSKYYPYIEKLHQEILKLQEP